MSTLVATWRADVAEWDAPRRLIATCAIGVSALLLWASIAQVDEVARGLGKVVPSSKVQVVQAAAPASISEILVREGQSVRRGQVLARLDDSRSASDLGQLRTENQRLSARAARLEQEGTGGAGGCATGSLCAEEQRLLQVRQATARSRQSALAAAIEQRRRDLSEGQETAAALENSTRLAREQVAMLQPLAAKGIVPQTDLLSAQRELVDVQGRLSAARQATARAAAGIREAEAQLAEARFDYRQQALNERSEIATRIAVNAESIRGASARVDRNELRAPTAGIVNDLQVSTVGGFVQAGETIMQVVPTGDRLLIEARVEPKDIAFIKVGDRAVVKVTAYDFSIYGGLNGRVQRISADSIYDEAERRAYYTVQVETDRAFIAKHGQRLPIVPGMVCDVEILTGRKSVLSYLLKPVTKGFDEALSER